MAQTNNDARDELAELVVEVQDDYDLRLVKPELQYCGKNHDQSARIKGVYQNWGVLFYCSEVDCGEWWVVCRQCSKSRQRLYTKRSVSQHKTKKHKSEAFLNVFIPPAFSGTSATKRTSEDICDDAENQHGHKRLSSLSASEDQDNHGTIFLEADDADAPMHMEADDQTQSSVFTSNYGIPFQPTVPQCFCQFSEKNRCFFQFCATRDSGTSIELAGAEYLVKTCLIDAQMTPEDLRTLDPIPVDFLLLIMEYARLCFNSGSKDRDHLCSLIQKMHASGVEDGWMNCLEAVNEDFNNSQPSWPLGHDYIKKEIAKPFSFSALNHGAHRYSFAFPKTVSDIRRMFFEYKNSIMRKLPFPDIHDDIMDHAYVSLVDCIRYALGLAACRLQVIDPFPDAYNEIMKGIFERQSNYWELNNNQAHVCHPSRSQRAYEIYVSKGDLSSDTVLGYLMFWHDDADTNSSSMQGRANVWVKSMTIGSPVEHGNFVWNTFPVALGDKSLSHDQVEERHNQDLRRLQMPDLEPFFVGDINQAVKCNFYLMADIADQPEKRGCNGLSHGNSLWAARSFVSANHFELYPRLKACTSCKEQMMKQFWKGDVKELPKCDKCLNWDVLKPNTDLCLAKLPENYPYDGLERHNFPPLSLPGFLNRVTVRTNQNNTVERYIRPFKITFRDLRLAIDEAHYGFCEHDWSEKMVRAFLAVECFSKKTVDEILEYAERAKAYRVVVDNGEIVDEFYKTILLQEFASSPHLFQPMPSPPTHCRPGVETSLSIEGLMHIGAIGFNKKTASSIQDVLHLKKCNSTFINENAAFLNPLRALNLEWLKLLQYSGGKFHGWNAENYLAFARVMPWFYQNLPETTKDKIQEVQLPDERTQKLWQKKHNMHWLKIRGLETDGDAREVRERVADYLLNGTAPPILPPVVVDDDLIKNTVVSLFDLWRCLLHEVVSEAIILETEHTIRVFLSCFDDLDAAIMHGEKSREKNKKGKKKESRKPSVVSSFNFSCMLNLPNIMRSHGPLRHFWEGKNIGEGFLPDIKKEHSQGIRKNWASNLLKNVFIDRSFQVLLSSTGRGGNESSDYSGSACHLAVGQRLFKQYSAIAEVAAILAETDRRRKQPISVVLVRGGGHTLSKDLDAKIFAVIRSREDTPQVVEIKKKDGVLSGVGGHEKFGWNYYEFLLLDSDVSMEWNTAVACFSVPCVEYALLLPLLDSKPIPRMFALIARNWRRLAPHNTIAALV